MHDLLVKQLVGEMAQWAAAIVEIVAIAVIVLIVLYSVSLAVVQRFKGVEGRTVIRDSRHRMARGILLGLEFLIAADIIRSVAMEMSFRTVGVLAVVVVVRTFLSFALEVELTGSWPWRREEEI